MPLVDDSDSVLVIVDAQPGFIDYEEMTDQVRATSQATVDRIAWLAGFSSLLDVPIIVVEEGPERNGHTDERITARLPVGTPIEQKETFSLAACDRAVNAISATGKRTLVVTGYETDVCVAQSAVELCDLGFRVIVPSDLTYSASADEHAGGLERTHHAGAEPNTFKGLIFEWMRTVERAEDVYRRADAEFRRAPYPRRTDAAVVAATRP
jgi:nicotinamidase-related amidase